MNRTYIPQNKENRWYIVDAKNKNLGRLSSQIALILKGKNEISYTPYINPKTYIIIINAKYIYLTGQKKYQKVYKKHSGRPGGLKITTFKELYAKCPSRIIEKSVKGMLPKNSLGRQLFAQLKVYSVEQHPHDAQQPKTLILK